MKKITKMLSVLLAIAVIICPMMSAVVVNADAPANGYSLTKVDATTLQLTIDSTDGFLVYQATVELEEADTTVSEFSVADYTLKGGADKTQGVTNPTVTPHQDGKNVTFIVASTSATCLDLYTQVKINFTVKSGTTATLTKIQAADDGDVDTDPTLLDFSGAGVGADGTVNEDSDYAKEHATPHEHNLQYQTNNNGTHTVTCTGCDYNEIEDCDTDGTDGACLKCGYKAAPTHVHDWVVDEIIQPTKTATGLRTYKCSDPTCQETKDPDVLPIPTAATETISTSIDFIVSNVVGIQFNISKKNALAAGYDDYFLDINYQGINGLYNRVNRNKKFLKDENTGSRSNDNMRFYLFKEIPIYDMTAEYTCVLYLMKNGVVTNYKDVSASSIAAVADDKCVQNATNAAMVTNMADMIAYGEAVQNYFADSNPDSDLAKTIALPSTIFTYGEHASDLGAISANYKELSRSTPIDSNWYLGAPSIIVAASNELRMTCKLPTPATYLPENYIVRASYTNGYGQVVSKDMTVANGGLSVIDSSASRNRYTAKFDEIALYDLEKTVTFEEIYNNQVMYKYEYKLSTYINENVGSGKLQQVALTNAAFYASTKAVLFVGTAVYNDD